MIREGKGLYDYKSGQAIGIKIDYPYEAALLGAVSKAVQVIQRGRFSYTFTEKESTQPGKKDFCTSVDHDAEKAIVSLLQSRFPKHGIICEEGNAEPWDGVSPYFTVDGLDGTREFMRGNLRATSSLTAGVNTTKEVICMCIADVVTNETCSYGPTSSCVVHTSGDIRRALPHDPKDAEDFSAGRILLRRPLASHRPVVGQLVSSFDRYENTEESLGVWIPRLWKREFRAAVLWHGSTVTPWDITPLIGASKKLGYVFLRTADNGRCLEEFSPEPPTTCHPRGEDVVIVHKNDLCLVKDLVPA